MSGGRLVFRLLFIWRHGDTRVATLASALSGYCWGICLAVPGDTLGRPTYRFMREVASEPIWTVLFLVVASLQMYRLYAKVTPTSVIFDFAIKFFAMLLWALVAILCLCAQFPIAAAMSDTVVISLLTIWDFSRQRNDDRGSYYYDIRDRENLDGR